MKIVAVVQARMGSTRLPGKVMMDLGGQPVLAWSVRACRSALGVNETYVATSVLPQDDVIAAWCVENRVKCWRGPEDDVLSRFAGALLDSQADAVLRITGDCPFIDMDVIATIVRLYRDRDNELDFVTNVSPRTYPDGLDVQLMSSDALLCADREAKRAIDRDGVCTWIERNRSRFPAETLICPIPDMQHERWVLDTKQDYEFCKALARRWQWHYGPPTLLNILHVLDTYPEIRHINTGHVMNERYFDALAEEPLYERTYKRSQTALARAEYVIPLGAQTFSKSKLQYPQPSPLFLSHGEGSTVWDVDGNEYIDLVSALLPNILGYRDADVDSAIRRQLQSGISFSLATELEAELAETLCQIIPCAEAVRFGKTGTDATSAAIRLARAFTSRDKVLVCGGYHGWQDWSVERNRGVPPDTQKNTVRIPYGDSPWLQGADRFAAVIVEANSNKAYLETLRAYCTQTDAILIFDEIITGFRYDIGGAQALFDVTPDLACFGKAMANGMPLSAVVGKRSIMNLMEPPDNIFFSGTFFGEALSLAASVATIKKIRTRDIIPKIWRTGSDLYLAAQDLIAQHDLKEKIWLSGKPCYVRIFTEDADIAALLRMEMVKTGVLITNSHNISAAHGPNEVRRIVKSYNHALGVVRKALDNRDVKERLAGGGIASGVRA